MEVKEKSKSFTYKRYMRDGSSQEMNGTTQQEKRIRTGKTAKDRNKRGHE